MLAISLFICYDVLMEPFIILLIVLVVTLLFIQSNSATTVNKTCDIHIWLRKERMIEGKQECYLQCGSCGAVPKEDARD